MQVDEEVDWVDKDQLPPLSRAKILALKICRHRCLVHSKSETALEVATPVLKMLFTVIENDGSLKKDGEDRYFKSPCDQ